MNIANKKLFILFIAIVIFGCASYVYWTKYSLTVVSSSNSTTVSLIAEEVSNSTNNEIGVQNSAGDEIKSRDTKNSSIANSILQFEGLSKQEVLVALFQLNNKADDKAQLVLALIEEGILSPNSLMREGGRSGHYTPLYAAMNLNRDLTPEQVSQFLELGVFVQPTRVWLRVMAGLSNADTIEMLLDEGGFNYQDIKLIAKHALRKGNLSGFLSLAKQSTNLNTDLKFTEDLVNSVFTEPKYDALEAELRTLNDSSYNSDPSVKDDIAEVSLQYGDSAAAQSETFLEESHTSRINIIRERLIKEIEKNKIVLTLPLSTEADKEKAKENIIKLENILSN